MTWAAGFCIFHGTLISTAVVSLILVIFYWYSVGRWVNDIVVKIVSLTVKCLAGFASVWGAYSIADRPDWWLPVVMGILSVLLWECVEKLVDHRVKSVDKAEKASLNRAQKECETRTELLTVFRRSVDEKTLRLIRKLITRPDRSSVSLVRQALTPEDHLHDLLHKLAVYLAAQLSDAASETTNFRVGLYVAREGVVQPYRAVNLNNPSNNVLSSFQKNAPAFRLDCTEGPSHAVQVIRTRSTIIVEDCIRSAELKEFHFLHDNQRGYLRSMLAYYLDKVYCDDGEPSEAALVIDTDAPGFFRDVDRESLEFCLREFSSRLKLELLLHVMLASRGPNS